MEFLNTIALIFGILSSILLIARIIGLLTYSESERIKDYLAGMVATFPIIKPFIISIICWTWVFTH